MMNQTVYRVCCSLLWRVFLFSTLVCMSTASAEEKESVRIVPAESLLVLKGSPGVPFRQPTDVSIGPNGHIYVMDGLNGRVVIFNKQGTYQNAFGSNGSGPGQMLMPVGIGISPSGEVYVADSGNHRIQVFTTQGNYTRSFSSADTVDIHIRVEKRNTSHRKEQEGTLYTVWFIIRSSCGTVTLQ